MSKHDTQPNEEAHAPSPAEQAAAQPEAAVEALEESRQEISLSYHRKTRSQWVAIADKKREEEIDIIVQIQRSIAEHRSADRQKALVKTEYKEILDEIKRLEEQEREARYKMYALITQAFVRGEIDAETEALAADLKWTPAIDVEYEERAMYEYALRYAPHLLKVNDAAVEHFAKEVAERGSTKRKSKALPYEGYDEDMPARVFNSVKPTIIEEDDDVEA